MSIQTNNPPEITITDQRAQLIKEAARAYHVPLLHFVHGFTRQWQDAENIVQELWKYALLRMPEHSIQSRYVLFDKARKLVIDHHRAKGRRPSGHSEELFEDNFVAKQNQEAYTTQEEDRLKADFFSEYPDIALTDAQKNVLWLHARYGFTYAEINTQTGHSVSTIGDWIKLARKRFAEYLNEEK